MSVERKSTATPGWGWTIRTYVGRFLVNTGWRILPDSKYKQQMDVRWAEQNALVASVLKGADEKTR